MRFLRTNTATRVTVGPFLDVTDGITPEVALTVTNDQLTFCVDTAGVPTLVLDVAPTASGGANDMVHITGDDAGMYDLELAAADVNYVGRAILTIIDTDVHLPVFHEFMILAAATYDAWFGTAVVPANVTQISGAAVSTSTAQLGVNAVQVGGTAQTGRDLGASVLLSPGTGAGQISLTGGAVTVGTNSDKTGYALSAAQTCNITGNITGNLSGSVGSVTGAVGSVTGAVGSVTGNVGGSVASVTGAVGSVTGNVGGNVTGTVGSVVGAVGSVTGNVGGSVASVTAVSSGAITAASFAAGAINAAAIAADAIGASELAADAATEIGTAVWATAARTLTAATNITSTGGTTVPQTGDSFARIGAAGASLTAVPWNAAWDAEVQSECADALTAVNVAEPAVRPTLTVEASGSNSATQFQTDRAETADDFWIGAMVLVTSGVLIGQVKEVGDYTGSTGVFILKSGDAFTGTPAAGVTMTILNR